MERVGKFAQLCMTAVNFSVVKTKKQKQLTNNEQCIISFDIQVKQIAPFVHS